MSRNQSVCIALKKRNGKGHKKDASSTTILGNNVANFAPRHQMSDYLRLFTIVADFFMTARYQ
jgi:hypothetical protein